MLVSQFDITVIHTWALLVNVHMTSAINTVLQGVASAWNTGCLWWRRKSQQPLDSVLLCSHAVWIVRSPGSHNSVVGALAAWTRGTGTIMGFSLSSFLLHTTKHTHVKTSSLVSLRDRRHTLITDPLFVLWSTVQINLWHKIWTKRFFAFLEIR